MHIHIHPRRIHLQKKNRHRKSPPHQSVVIPLKQRRIQTHALHGSPIHKKNLLRPRCPTHPWPSQNPSQTHSPILHIQRQDRPPPLLSKYSDQSLLKALACRVLPKNRAISPQYPTHIRPCQRGQPYPLLDMPPLRLLRSQKLSSPWHVRKKLPYLNARPCRTTRLPRPHHFSSIDNHLSPLRRIRLPRL